MVFYSSLIAEGNGEALVVATGDQTILGEFFQDFKNKIIEILYRYLKRSC
jgi:magnesium-transporting ATPase (P-type)